MYHKTCATNLLKLNKLVLFLYYMLNLILLVIDKLNFADIFKNSIGVPSPKMYHKTNVITLNKFTTILLENYPKLFEINSVYLFLDIFIWNHSSFITLILVNIGVLLIRHISIETTFPRC